LFALHVDLLNPYLEQNKQADIHYNLEYIGYKCHLSLLVCQEI